MSPRAAHPALATVATVASCAVLALGLAAAIAGDDGKAARRSLYPSELEQGAGHDLAGRWCLMCHSASLVTQQAKDSTAWEKTLVQMEKWGVKLTPGEHDTLRAYLVAHYGPGGSRVAPR